MQRINDILVTLLALLITIIFHELAHGYMALFLGDDTAKRAGRLTLNPLKHIDPLGMVTLFVFKFGWAKPVPINFERLKPKTLGMILVSVAGVVVNLILAFWGILVFAIFYDKVANNLIAFNFLRTFIIMNISFAAFNILPFPPLDGSKVLISFLPSDIRYKIFKYERYIYLLLVALIFSGYIQKILNPIVEIIYSGLFNIVRFFI